MARAAVRHIATDPAKGGRRGWITIRVTIRPSQALTTAVVSSACADALANFNVCPIQRPDG